MIHDQQKMLVDAQHRWGHLAEKNGLTIVAANLDTITVERTTGTKPYLRQYRYFISTQVLKEAPGWAFEDVARRISVS